MKMYAGTKIFNLELNTTDTLSGQSSESKNITDKNGKQASKNGKQASIQKNTFLRFISTV